MITIVDVNSTQFTFNGITYYKNFTPIVRGDYIEVVNTYDSKLKLCEPTIYSDFDIDSTIYGNVSDTQDALLPVLFTRSSLGGGEGGSGTVTSVAVSGSDGIEVDSGSPITTSGTIALGINASDLRSHINVEDGAEVNTVDSVNGETGTVVLEEEDIIGTRLTNTSVTGSTALDWDAYKVFEFTLTGNTTLTDSNLPTGTETKVIEMVVTGDFTLTPPAYWEALPSNDAYDGTVRNHIVVSCINGTASSEDVLYSLTNLST